MSRLRQGLYGRPVDADLLQRRLPPLRLPPSGRSTAGAASLRKDGACGKTVRSFRCLRCGTLVSVTNRADKRVKFCSPRCERLYWKHSEHAACQAVVRTFSCRQCGRTVTVTEAKDRRTAFCSADCRIQWFSAHRKRST